FGGNVRISGALMVGAQVLVTKGLSFIGFSVTVGLSLQSYRGANKTDKFGNPKPTRPWGILNSMPNGQVVETGIDVLQHEMGRQAPHYDAALRVAGNHISEDTMLATALAASMSPFKPRYYGRIRTLDGKPLYAQAMWTPSNPTTYWDATLRSGPP